MDAQSVPMIRTDNQKNRNISLGLENNYKVFLFSSVVQALFSLQSFQDHLKYFTTDKPSDPDAVSNVKGLFGDIEQTRELSRRSIRNHECVSI